MVKRRKTRATGGNQKSGLERATPILHSDTERLHLTAREVEQLLEAAKGGRNEARDRCLLLLLFRHGLRVSEGCGLELSQVDTESRVLHVHRLKHGLSTDHPLRGDELRAISAWLKVRDQMKVSAQVTTFFVSERRRPMH